MMPLNIIDVSEESFEYEVIAFSAEMPVVVDFWAPWCIPCRVQSQILAQLSQEMDGKFRLARVNVDQQTKLAERLNVRDLPAIKAFVDGRMVAEYVGVLTEKNLRQLVERIMPRTGNLALAKGKSLLIQGKYEDALEAIDLSLEAYGDEAPGLLAFARALLALDESARAMDILINFPISHEKKTAELLLPVAFAYLDPAMDEMVFDQPLESAFRNAVRMARKGKIAIGLDGLLGVLKKDKHYREDRAKEIYLGLLEILSDDHPDVRHYRADLASALF
jgi:putative thioredoxin